MIGAPRREGQIGSELQRSSAHERAWKVLDRRAPLALKLVVTIGVVTAAGAVLLAYLLTRERPTMLWIAEAGAAVAAVEAGLLVAAIEFEPARAYGSQILRPHV